MGGLSREMAAERGRNATETDGAVHTRKQTSINIEISIMQGELKQETPFRYLFLNLEAWIVAFMLFK